MPIILLLLGTLGLLAYRSFGRGGLGHREGIVAPKQPKLLPTDSGFHTPPKRFPNPGRFQVISRNLSQTARDPFLLVYAGDNQNEVNGYVKFLDNAETPHFVYDGNLLVRASTPCNWKAPLR